MKKAAVPGLLAVVLLLLASSLTGCPIYDDETAGCYGSSACPSGSSCDVDTGSCVPNQEVECHRPSDCGGNETCGSRGICRIGDCSFASVGCVRGYSCSRAQGIWECTTETDGVGGQPATQGEAGQAGQGVREAAGGAGGA